MERGYSFQRWQHIVNSILFKDPDNVRLHRTRIIHIYEADFNLAMGLKWRVATQQAEDLNKKISKANMDQERHDPPSNQSISKNCSAKFRELRKNR